MGDYYRKCDECSILTKYDDLNTVATKKSFLRIQYQMVCKTCINVKITKQINDNMKVK